ncbi:MAG: aspartate 1-decarboxylase [Oscillospiraceae bacterium]|nr:aspartate 1-decarboxylase [Oscillospiraceae bacterium]
MYITKLKSKIHRARVTQADLNYIGSITIDSELMKEANISENEKVSVVDINNGNRFETYVIPGEANSGIICLNGAAARMVQVDDRIIIMAYAMMTTEEEKDFVPDVIVVDKDNRMVDKLYGEKHGIAYDS